MVRILLALLFCLGCSASALADGRAFPPDNCSSATPFMAFNGVASNGNTFCINGQNILSNALPACGADQVVAFDGSHFVCKEGGTPPNCSAGQFLTFTNGAYGCGTADVPTCGGNQVLTYNGSAFICVAKTDSIPSCGANEFLTYNGSTFQCAATQNLTIPSCAPGEVLTANGSSLSCTTPASTPDTGTMCGLYLDYGKVSIAPCKGASVANWQGNNITSNCPTGYMLTAIYEIWAPQPNPTPANLYTCVKGGTTPLMNFLLYN